MQGRLGTILRRARGDASRLSFARKLRLSYTFVRSLEEGLRLPSDDVLIEIADHLGLDRKELILAAYCDRSSVLEGTLRECGVTIPEYEHGEEPDLEVTPQPKPEGPIPRVTNPDPREAAG